MAGGPKPTPCSRAAPRSTPGIRRSRLIRIGTTSAATDFRASPAGGSISAPSSGKAWGPRPLSSPRKLTWSTLPTIWSVCARPLQVQMTLQAPTKSLLLRLCSDRSRRLRWRASCPRSPIRSQSTARAPTCSRSTPATAKTAASPPATGSASSMSTMAKANRSTWHFAASRSPAATSARIIPSAATAGPFLVART